MDLLSDIRSVLEGAGYATFSPRPDSTFLYFEDISIMGYLQILPSVKEIINNWEGIQDGFLKTNASRFQRDAQKAWNLYTILLTSQVGENEEVANLLEIEEDFRSTRKIMRAGIVTRGDVLTVLSPILPLENIQPVGITDANELLRERLGKSDLILQNIVTDTTAKTIFQKLLE